MGDINEQSIPSEDNDNSKTESERPFKKFLTFRKPCETESQEQYPNKHAELEKEPRGLLDSLRDTPIYKTNLLGSSLPDPHAFELPAVNVGQLIGDFKLVKLIGQGGMGQVWEAKQVSTNRSVALKIIKPDKISPRALELFAREARVGGRLDHPGIVTMFDHGEEGGIHWIAMELIEGNCTLRNILDNIDSLGKLSNDYYRKATFFLVEIVNAMQAAHEAGVIHRDLKPHNILITQDEKPIITDFGLARITDESAISRTGDFAGTYYYMSPEQVTAGRINIDHRTDIFSLGVVFYEMLALRRPFEGDTTHQVYEQIVTHDPPNLLEIRSRVPKALAIICGKALEKRRNQRYQSMEEFAADLNNYLNCEPIKARAPGMVRRSTKWIHQHPIMSATSAVVAMALLVFSFLLIFALNERNNAVASQRETEEQSKIAVIEKERALAAEEKAEGSYNEIMRLSDIKRLSDLEYEAEALWPAYPENVSKFKEWLINVDDLLGRLNSHRHTLDSLRGKALPYGKADRQKDRETHPQWKALQGLTYSKPKLEDQITSLEAGDTKNSKFDPLTELKALKEIAQSLEDKIIKLEIVVSERRTWKFVDTETQWQHDMVTELVSGLDALSDKEEGLIPNIQERLAFASTIEVESITAYQDAWDEAITCIRNKEVCPHYNGLAIEPNIGFVPIGLDPASGLWEFAHLQTGTIPKRDSDGELLLTEEMGLVFVLIPGGIFNMGAVQPSEGNPIGSPNVDSDASKSEGPVHEVCLKPFFLSKFEMTQGQWLRYTDKNPSKYDPLEKIAGYQPNLLHPVEQVSWNDCTKVLFQLKLRFPTESEWEYATRAGTSTVFFTGNERESLQGVASLADLYLKLNGGPTTWRYEESLNDGYGCHAPVRTLLPNAFGLHDVHGNVMEWCQDEFTIYEFTPIDGTATKLFSSSRVIRGGSWSDSAFSCRSAYRGERHVDYKGHGLGIRPAADLRLE